MTSTTQTIYRETSIPKRTDMVNVSYSDDFSRTFTHTFIPEEEGALIILGAKGTGHITVA